MKGRENIARKGREANGLWETYGQRKMGRRFRRMKIFVEREREEREKRKRWMKRRKHVDEEKRKREIRRERGE